MLFIGFDVRLSRSNDLFVSKDLLDRTNSRLSGRSDWHVLDLHTALEFIHAHVAALFGMSLRGRLVFGHDTDDVLELIRRLLGGVVILDDNSCA